MEHDAADQTGNTQKSRRDQRSGLLDDWINRDDLARELGVSVDTLARWETRRVGPACIRIGRKVHYKRSGVQKWLCDQEGRHPRSGTRK